MGGRQRARTIFAMGGAEFTGLGANEALHDYIVGLASAPRPRICLLPTASGDPDEQIAGYYRVFTRRACDPSHVSLFRLGTEPVRLRDHLLSQDVIYVGGGSMVNLLAIWRAHGLDKLLREAWEQGTVLVGLSAGSMCWFEGGVTTGAGEPKVAGGLGVLPGSNCVHYRAERERRTVFLRAIATGELAPGYGVDDHCGLLFRGRELEGVVSGDRSARAYRIERAAGRAHEHPLEAEILEAPRSPVPDEVQELRRLRELRDLSRRRPVSAVRVRRRGP